MNFFYKLLFVLILISGWLKPAFAKVSKVEITSREVILNGRTFGKYGAYELIKGKIFFEFDPANAANSKIVNISLAARSENGMVESWSDLVVLKPVNPGMGNGVALVEVSNRGGKFSPRYFNRGRSGLKPDSEQDFGDGLLMENGFTVIWIGWQFDVQAGNGNLKLHVPIAKNTDGTEIMGLVRSDWIFEAPARVMKLGHRQQIGYPVADPNHPDNVLTVRDGRDGSRVIIPREEWQFGRIDQANGPENEIKVVPDDSYIYMEKGFEPGKIYEMVYVAKDPPVVGLGMGAIRDVITYAKNNSQCPFKVDKGIAAGVSQTGRFLRHFLYQNFNMDEEGRKCYDGMMIITAGAGRGSFNHQFAQPSRDAHRYSAFFYPTDIFPFTSHVQQNPLFGNSDGLLAHMAEKYYPKIFYINTGYEYWGRAASLIHTATDGEADIETFDNERIYHIGSGQHFVNGFPPNKGNKLNENGLYRGNHLDFSVNYRALLIALSDWVAQNKIPPASRYPQVKDNTLVSIDQLDFPKIPGVTIPKVIHTVYSVDYGPRWGEGIIDYQPPRLSAPIRPKVAQVNTIGNEVAGIQNIEVQVPLATYTPWNLRMGMAGDSQELTDFRGSFIPLPKTEKERNQKGDPRPSIASLYKNKKDYLQKIERAANTLIQEGFLLPVDKKYVIDRAEGYWKWVMTN
ncbi:alpha/beta hydrolase domain-containing protein [Fulvivirgaceae bacterium BMA12]|uniref:Alpha/beta hydrolase domain-containing protein n=1 Tax=Agaribacillus aureus TaxID=3051825 RepID=A0ABT8L1Q1_9BACT|nr:alpha/beta hydrolase domain-containing protein [Fulvivirgaceae bacterium BMA12]